MKTAILTTLLFALSGGLLLADKATDERLANPQNELNDLGGLDGA